ncbi:MAG: sulfur carrier protein ThiS [Desulfotomaculum sp.]|nr:sulfur carrier protein ThiS [Desulfotomaculum sp.]
MKLIVNGRDEILDREMTILEFLQTKGIDPSVVVVEYNLDIADREKWGEITLKDSDKLEILQFVGGG